MYERQAQADIGPRTEGLAEADASPEGPSPEGLGAGTMGAA
jgi:hypothetical protein